MEKDHARKALAEHIDLFDSPAPDALVMLRRAETSVKARQTMRNEYARRGLRIGVALLILALVVIAGYRIPAVHAFITEVIAFVSDGAAVCEYSIDLPEAELLSSNARQEGQYQSAVYKIEDMLVEIYVEPLGLASSSYGNRAERETYIISGLPIGYDAVVSEDEEGSKAVIEMGDRRVEVLVKDHDSELLRRVLKALIHAAQPISEKE
jgi:hypothetical protein